MALRVSLLPRLLVGTLSLLAPLPAAAHGGIDIDRPLAWVRAPPPRRASGALLGLARAGPNHETAWVGLDARENGESRSPIRADRWRRELVVAFQAGLPQGDFVGAASFGAAFFAGLGLPNLPVVLGGDFGFLIRGGDRETLAESEFSSLIADTSSDITMLHFVARLQPASGRFRPFLDAVIGFKHFETRTRINEYFRSFGTPDDCFFSDCTIAVDNDENSSDIALSYGVGAGLDIQIYAGKAVRVSIVVGARYLFGEEAEYVIPSSVRIVDEDTVEFEIVETRTDLLTTQFGFSVLF